MRLQIVCFDKEANTSFDQFLHFGKIGEGHRCRGTFKPINDCQIERTNSIAATIFIQKDSIVLFHWHITPTGKNIEDETSHAKMDDYEKLQAHELFEKLVLSSAGRIRRMCPN